MKANRPQTKVWGYTNEVRLCGLCETCVWVTFKKEGRV